MFVDTNALQQHLPFTVLKPTSSSHSIVTAFSSVATAPTVYGIETLELCATASATASRVATAPTVYGIETF